MERSVTSAEAAPPEIPLHRNRNFALLWSGQIVSDLGTRVTTIAFPLLVLAITHSPAKAGIAGFCGTLPYALFYLPAGAMLDQYDRKRIMLICEVGRFIALGSIAVAAWIGRLTYPHILAVSFVGGTFFVFFSVAEKSIVPSLVPATQLTTAIARQEARSRAAVLAGAPLGGVLYGIATAVPFLFDALSYAVSFMTTFFIKGELKARREQTAGNLAHEIGQGVRWLLREPFIRTSVVLMGLINIDFQALMLTLIVLSGKLGASSTMTGVIIGCYGFGGLIGALAAPRLQRHLSPRSVAIGATWIWAALLLPLSLVSWAPALCPLAASIAFLGPLWNVVLVGYQYRVIPDHLLSRIKSVVLLVSWGMIPLGSLIAGYLLDFTSPHATVLALTALMTVIAITATLSPGIRRIGSR